MTELELLDRIIPTLPSNDRVIAGAGDDCAVLRGGSRGSYFLLKTDAIVEGVHFDPGTEPERIGHKALARCLSDVAAMAGRPMHAVVTLGLPLKLDDHWVERIYHGLNRLAKRYAVAVVGGETVASPERL